MWRFRSHGKMVSETVVEALPLLAARHAVALIAASGAVRSHLERLANRLGVAHRLLFVDGPAQLLWVVAGQTVLALSEDVGRLDVPPGDPVALAGVITRLLDDPKLALEMASAP